MTEWLTPEQVADEMGWSLETVRIKCRAGLIPGATKPLGVNRWRIPAEALEPQPARPLIAPRSRRSAAQLRRNT